MTTKEPQLVHFVASGLTVPVSRTWTEVMKYGDELTITDEIREASRDRNGVSWCDLLNDEPAQVRRYGKVFFRPGPFPADVSRVEPGSDEHRQAAWQARREASSIENPVDRRAALREVEREYGPDATRTSKTLSVYAGSE